MTSNTNRTVNILLMLHQLNMEAAAVGGVTDLHFIIISLDLKCVAVQYLLIFLNT